MQQTSTAPDEKFDQLAGSSFTTQDSPLRRARPAKRNGIKSVRIEVQSDSVERKKKHNDEDPQKVQKNKNKKALTKGFMNDSSILPAKKRSRRDNIEAKKDDYDDPDREWEVLVRNLIFFRRKEMRTMKIDYKLIALSVCFSVPKQQIMTFSACWWSLP
jgi:hypothetical protein